MNTVTDIEFLRRAIQAGTWERYEHPERGETLSLRVGNVAVLSLHNILAAEGVDLNRLVQNLADPALVATLMARLAKVEYQLRIATKALAGQPLPINAEPATPPHRCLLLPRDKGYEITCSACEFTYRTLDSQIAEQVAKAHVDAYSGYSGHTV